MALVAGAALLQDSASLCGFSIGPETVRRAAQRIQGIAHETPVLTCTALDELAGRKLHFKCESFQKTGSFKFRGALAALCQLREEGRCDGGVTTHSSGNHAQAVALAARITGTRATIVMPRDAPLVKRAAVEQYGANVVLCDPREREIVCRRVADESGAVIVHPSNEPMVMSGQGTIAVEFLAQVAELDALIVPVGGGGMLSGICMAAKSMKPQIRIFGAEPSAADDAFRSLQRGEVVGHEGKVPTTVADGLRTTLGSNNFPIIKALCERIFLVEEAKIVQGMRTVMERMKVVVEPSAGVGVAVALWSDEFRALEGIERVGVVLCGGNLDLNGLSQLLNQQ